MFETQREIEKVRGVCVLLQLALLCKVQSIVFLRETEYVLRVCLCMS